MSPSVLVAYYSRTGTTAAVAEAVLDHLEDPAVERIRPRRSRSYLNWLARSFVPGAAVPIEPIEHDPRDYDAVFLGTPKWTLSCPPVTAYLDQVRFDGAAVGLCLTFGGFDEERYAHRLVERLHAAGADAVETLLVKRERVEAESQADPSVGTVDADVATFAEAVLKRAAGD